MSIALKVYQGLTEETDEKVKAKLIADAFEELEQRYPEVKDLATGAQLTEKSLLLQKEIQNSKIEMMGKMERQTWLYFGGLTGMATILIATMGLMIKFLR